MTEVTAHYESFFDNFNITHKIHIFMVFFNIRLTFSLTGMQPYAIFNIKFWLDGFS